MGVEPIRRLRTTGLANLRITVLPALHILDYTLMVLDFLLDLIFPRFCVGCGKFGKYFCPKCFKKIRFYSNLISPDYHCPENLDGIFVLAHYDGVIRKAIKEIKYRGRFAILQELAEMMLASPPGGNFQFDYLVPVPLAKKRQTERGFNQAEKLANYLKLAPVLNCLKRTRDTKPQFDLSSAERLKNVKNAFIHNSKYIIHSSAVCLIDDVATTGATLSECAKVLKNARAAKVYAICIARGG